MVLEMERGAVRHARHDDAIGAIVAGRYRVDQELARGGVGQVFRAHDLSTDRPVALKRLQGGARPKSALLALFEREYRTLHSLKHPRIIEVYDYGIDAGGAYYTMELLPGTDLGKLAPLPYRQACAYLRDVASSLALLHARRLLHRDISPHNVRVTDRDRCKLIDFGALMGFGVASHVVGTPPCIAPEAVRGAPLDQRTDLYALGATAYYLLTRRHAFYAKSISELGAAWQRPAPRPSQYAPDVPPALDELVLSLLNHDPLARPESAAEVIDRLNAVAGLPSIDEPLAAASYFWSTALIGREAQLEEVHGALRSVTAGKGSALVFEGGAGVGRSRVLSEACVQAQLAGATVLEVDAEGARGENGVALALAATLLEAAPQEALAAAVPHAAVLAQLSPSLAARLETSERAAIPQTPGEWRGRVQAALTGWFAGVGELRPLVIAVDNLESADDASTALLAALASQADARKLLILTALRSAAAERADGGLRFLREASTVVELARLTSEQTVALARAMFGDVPNVMPLGEWMFRAGEGIASHCFELATELRRRGIVRYVGGTWVVPQDAALQGLPSGLREALAERLSRLSPEAAALAEALAVHAAPLGIELCRAAADAASVREVFAGLDELTANDVLALSGERYRFRQETLRELLLERLDDARKRALHRAMGHALLDTSEPEDRMARVDAGWHLLRGGEELPGAQLLQRTAMEFEIGTGSLQAAIPALEEARKVYWKHRRSLYELLPIVTRLAAEGYYSDRRLSLLYAEEAFALLRKATGLDLADRLRPLLGRKLGVYAGLCWAALRFYATPRARRPARFSDIFVLLVNCVTTQAGAGTVCLDTAAIGRAASFIEPLTALGPAHITSAIHEYCLSLQLMTVEQQPEVRRRWLALLERLSDPAQFATLPDYVRQLYRGGALFALGIVETWHDGEDALDRAQELEGLGLRIYDRAAHQIRMLYHAGRGELDLAEQYRKRMELHAVQTGSAWQVEVTVPLTLSVVYSLLGDLVGVKRVGEQIAQLAQKFELPALARTARLARTVSLVARGSADFALEDYREIFAGAPVRSFTGWARAVGHQADAYNQLGRHEEALRVCTEALIHVRPEDRRFVRMFLLLEIQLAMAEAGVGRAGDAALRLQALIAEHEPAAGPVTLGLLHEARARVALGASDAAAFREHMAEAERWLWPTRVPTLIARCELLAQQGAEKFDFVRAASSRPTGGVSTVLTARSALSQCTDLRERTERALALLLEESAATEGHLFLVNPDGQLELAASRSAKPPSRTLLRETAAMLESFREDAEATRLQTHAAVATVELGKPRLEGFRTHLLWSVVDGAPKLVGIAAIRGGDSGQIIGFHLLQALADGLRGGTIAP
jgi:hypothetical protein